MCVLHICVHICVFAFGGHKTILMLFLRNGSPFIEMGLSLVCTSQCKLNCLASKPWDLLVSSFEALLF